MKRSLFPLVALTLLATSSAYAQKATASPAFSIGGEAFAQADILDGRALPGLDGEAEIMLTFDDKAAKHLESLTSAQIGRPLPIVLDGRTLAAPSFAEPVIGGVLTIAGGFTLAEAEALAKHISGKDPLPDEFDE